MTVQQSRFVLKLPHKMSRKFREGVLKEYKENGKEQAASSLVLSFVFCLIKYESGKISGRDEGLSFL